MATFEPKQDVGPADESQNEIDKLLHEYSQMT